MKDLLTIMTLSSQEAFKKLFEHNPNLYYSLEVSKKDGKIESVLTIFGAHGIDIHRLARALDFYDFNVKVESEDDNYITKYFYHDSLKIKAYIRKDQ
jgi:hypothetical protein